MEPYGSVKCSTLELYQATSSSSPINVDIKDDADEHRVPLDYRHMSVNPPMSDGQAVDRFYLNLAMEYPDDGVLGIYDIFCPGSDPLDDPMCDVCAVDFDVDGNSTSPTDFVFGADGGNVERRLDAKFYGRNKKKGACFSSETVLSVKGKGLVRMEQLRIGDMVLTKGGVYSTVYSFLHFEPHEATTFLRITTTETTLPFEITHDHLLYIYDQKLKKRDVVNAGSIKVGDFLVGETGQMEVVSIENTERVGLYAPLTHSGDVFVSGALASSYVTLPVFQGGSISDRMANLCMHAVFAPYGAYCALFGCHGETYNDSGLPTYVEFLLKVHNGLH